MRWVHCSKKCIVLVSSVLFCTVADCCKSADVCLECCYSKVMEEGHRCVERAMHHNCPVCFEVKPITSTILVWIFFFKKKKMSDSHWDDFFCPLLQYLFDTVRDITVLPCGHTIHLECVKEMEQHHR